MSKHSRVFSGSSSDGSSASQELGFYPEIVHDSRQPWTVNWCSPIEAKVNLKDRIGFVPENLTEIDINIQNHEYGHVKITDVLTAEEGGTRRKRGTIEGELQYFLEECRVNLWLAKSGIPYILAYDGFNWAAMPRPTTRLAAACQWLQCATYVLPDRSIPIPPDLQFYFDELHGTFHGGDWRILNRAYQRLVESELKRSTRDELARMLADHFSEVPEVQDKPTVLKPEYSEERSEEKERREEAQERAEARDKEPGEIRSGSTQLGAMEVHRHITRTKPGRRIAQNFGSSEVGAIPTQFARKAIDGKLFKRKRSTGAIIIDMSGSMSWDWNQLRDLIHKLPNLIIAGYYGVGREGKNWRKAGVIQGRLCVYGEKGRWAEPTRERDYSGGNDVDIEALEWGAKVTDGPVVWLSDGQVVGGIYGHDTATIARKCDEIMRKRGIVRIANQEDARDYFKKKPTTVYVRCDNRSRRQGRMK
jgi:hypothetical protein